MRYFIGLVQTNSRGDYQANLEFAHQCIEDASRNEVDLIAFPETFLYLGESREDKFKIAQTLEGEIIQKFQELALKYNISILMGSIYELVPNEPSKLFNTSVLLDRKGELQGVYRKIHLCDIDSPSVSHFESRDIKSGEEAVVVDHEIGKVGLSICYDLRFPGLYQNLRAKGAQIIFVPSAFFLQTGKNHWLPLLQARAIENQVYIAAPAQWGWHHGTRFSYGNSVLIDPWGTVLSCAPERPDMIIDPIDLNYLEKVRERMPVLEHRRTDCYGI